MKEPHFINPEGYSLKPNLEETIKQGKQIYRFILDEAFPLAFWDGEKPLQINKKMDTDLGSVPRLLQWIRGFSKDDWEICYLFHDDTCKRGGLWSDGKFIKIPREEADRRLRLMIPIEAKLKKKQILGFLVKWPIWAGVWIGAKFGVGRPEKKKHNDINWPPIRTA